MYTAAIFLPLIGAVIAGCFGRVIGLRASQYLTTGLLTIAAVLGWVILYQTAWAGGAKLNVFPVYTWIASGDLKILWSLRFDTLSAVMVVVVTTVSALVHLYSIGYMEGEEGQPRFFAYLSLFTFSMLMLVTADNFIQMFFGWEGVGLCSYLLIGFWYRKESANLASIKAFVVNRVGDFGFALGIFAVWVVFGSLEFGVVLPQAAAIVSKQVDFVGTALSGEAALTIACLLLFVGAMGKSAQILLHTWLPDAMEGPTPVSALIHAATMVTAGVFMVCRLSPMFEYAPDALTAVTVVGAVTALFAATVGLTQTDIKRVVAYSTCSQLGYMFFAAGVSAYPAAMFHLTTHAFFKALLFLGSGSVIMGMHHEQDMRNMGGVGRHMKYTYAMMWIGSLALAGIGVPLILGSGLGFAGFHSKDAILEAAFGAGGPIPMAAFWFGIVAALLTAFYSWRLLFLTFHGAPRYDTHHHTPHEPGLTVLVPLGVLAIGAVLSGALLSRYFVGKEWAAFWGDSIKILVDKHPAMPKVVAHALPHWVTLLPLIVAVAGIALAWYAYIVASGTPKRFAERFPRLYRFSLNKWYFDELYDRLIVRPAFRLGRNLWKTGDGAVIDGAGPDGVAAAARASARRIAGLQSGYVYHYAFAIVIGVAVLVTLYLAGGLR